MSSSDSSSIRISAVQMSSTDDKERNLEIAGRLISEAAREGAQIVALPENFAFLGEGEAKLGAAEEPDDGPAIRFLRDAARSHGIDVIGGTIPIRAGGNKVTNTCFVVNADGDVIARYDKIHLFDVAIDEEHSFRESQYVAAGDHVVTVDLRGMTMGLTICYDLRFPELYRRLAVEGAGVMFVPSAFTEVTGKAHWEILLRARAVENLCYVVAPAQYGRHSERRISHGNSIIVGPWGDVLASVTDGDAVITADVLVSRLEDVRRRLPALGHARLI